MRSIIEKFAIVRSFRFYLRNEKAIWQRYKRIQNRQLLIQSSTPQKPNLLASIKPEKELTPRELYNRILEESGYKSFNLPFASKLFDYVERNHNIVEGCEIKPGMLVYLDMFNYNNSFNSWDCGGNIITSIHNSSFQNRDFFRSLRVASVGLSMRDDDKLTDRIMDYFYENIGNSHVADLFRRLLNKDCELTQTEFRVLRPLIPRDFFFSAVTIEDESCNPNVVAFPRIGALTAKAFIPVQSSRGKVMKEQFRIETRKERIRAKIQDLKQELEVLSQSEFKGTFKKIEKSLLNQH